MIDFHLFHFLRPWWLLVLIPALLLLWLRRHHKGASPWQSVVDEHLQPYVLVGTGARKKNAWDYLSLPLFLMLLSLALAGPTYKKIPDESELLRKPLVIVLEMSDHMSSTDISPSRLRRAIYKLKDLLHKEKGREVSLIAFAGDSHIVVPLTNDHATLINLLESLHPELMPKAGSNVLDALQQLQDLESLKTNADILLVTSTNVKEEPHALVNYVEKNHLHLYVWAFATSTGAPLIAKGGQFARDKEGITISSLKNSWLEGIKKKGFVETFLFTPDERDIIAIDYAMAKNEQIRKGDKKESYDSWYDIGPFVLAVAMVVFLLSVLRRSGSWWLLSILVVFPAPKAEASFWGDLFKRDDQRAHEALYNNEPLKAAELYSDDFSKGTAFYKAKRFADAASHLAHVKTPDGFYNLGNSYAQLGKVDEGIKAYSEALKLDPHHADARHNKELLEKLKKNEEQNSQNDQKDQNQDQEKKEEQKEQSEQDGQNKEQEKEPEKDQEKQKQEQKNEKPAEEKEQEKKESEKAPEPSENKEQKEDNAAREQDKKMNEDKEAKEREVETKKSLDKNALQQLDHLGSRNNNKFLERKFRYETRTRKGGEQ